MPNPVKALKSYKNLSTRQKRIVAKVRRAGLTPVGYHRASYKGRRTRSSTSVHDPFLDITRHAKAKDVKVTKTYPQAYDTPRQRNTRVARRVRWKAGRAKGTLKSLLFP